MRRTSLLLGAVVLSSCSAGTEVLSLGDRPTPSGAPDPTIGCDLAATAPRLLPEGTYVEPPFLVDGAQIVSAIRPLSAASFDVFRIAADDSISALVGSDEDDLLVDARGGRVLFARGPAIAELDGGLERQIGRIESGRWSFLGQPARRAIGDGFVAWIDVSLDAVMRSRDGLLQPVSSGFRRISALDVSGPLLAFFAESGQRLVIVRGDQVEVVETGESVVQDVRILGSEVYWASSAGLSRWADGRVERLLPGRCSVMSGSTRAVVVACELGSEGATEVVIIDGGQLRRHPLTQRATAVAISDRLVAWTTHPSADCGEMPGRLTVHARGGVVLGRVLVDVEVGAPCWCCDAYWAPPYVALSDEVVAWNYAGLERTRRGTSAYQRITASDGCPRR